VRTARCGIQTANLAPSGFGRRGFSRLEQARARETSAPLASFYPCVSDDFSGGLEFAGKAYGSLQFISSASGSQAFS
jgi:hypothetical protein